MEAETLARALLLRMLSRAQRDQFETLGHFLVKVPGHGTFRILPRPTLNVVDVISGAGYCAVPDRHVPLFDALLTQKLILENEPERFFSVAKRFPAKVFASRWKEEGSLGTETSADNNRRRSRTQSSIGNINYLP